MGEQRQQEDLQTGGQGPGRPRARELPTLTSQGKRPCRNVGVWGLWVSGSLGGRLSKGGLGKRLKLKKSRKATEQETECCFPFGPEPCSIYF